MAKPINPTLLFESLCWVLYQYASRTPEAQRARSIRPYLPDDGKRIAVVIKTIRHAYNCQQRAYEYGRRTARPDFEQMKQLVMASLQHEHSWDERTRNLYSSVASTYIGFDHNGKADINARKLAVVTAYGRMFLNPNYAVERGTQLLLPL
jgi:hypothetical protein